MYNPENKETQFVQNLRLFESVNKLTHEEFATLLGVSDATVATWFSSKKTMPDPRSRKALEKVFGAKFEKICSRAMTVRLSIDASLSAEDVYPYNVFIAATMDENAEETDFEDFSYRDLSLNDCYNIFHNSLTERENRVIEMRFRDGGTLEDVGHKLGVIRERVRQIEHKALRKISRQLVYLKRKKDTMNELQSKYDQLCGYVGSLEKTYYGKTNYYSPNLATPIEDLDFTVRTYNCLKRAGINTIHEIISYKNSLFDIRNLGLHSVEEVDAKIKSMNIGYKLNYESGYFVEDKVKC